MKNKLTVRSQFVISFVTIAIGLILFIPWVLDKKSSKSSSDFCSKLNIADDESFESKLTELEVVNDDGLGKSIEVIQTSSSQTNFPEKEQQNLLESSSSEEVIEISESTNTFDSSPTQMNQITSLKTAEKNAESLSVFIKEKFAEIFKKTAQVTRETTKIVHARALDLGGKIARATTQATRVVQEKSVEIAKKTAQVTRETTKVVHARALDLGGKIARATTQTIRVVQEKSVEIAKKTAQVTKETTKVVHAQARDFGGKIARATTQATRVVQEKSVETAKKTAQVTRETTKVVHARALDLWGKIAQMTTQTIGFVQEKFAGLIQRITLKIQSLRLATTQKGLELAVDEPVLADFPRDADSDKKVIQPFTETSEPVREKVADLDRKIETNPEQQASLDGVAIVEKSAFTEIPESSRTSVAPVMQSETVQKDPIRTNLEITESVHEIMTDSGKKTEQEKESIQPEITQSETLQQASGEIEESVKSPIQIETIPLASPDSPSTSIPVQNILESQKQTVSVETVSIVAASSASVPSKGEPNESNQTSVERIQKSTPLASTKTEKESSSTDSSSDQVSGLFETKMDVAVNENRETNRTELKVVIDANQKVNQSQLKDKVVQSQDGGKDCLEITCAVLDEKNEADPDKGNSVDIQVTSIQQKSTKEGVKYPSGTVKVVSKHSPTEKSELTDAAEHSPAPVIPAAQSEIVQREQEQTPQEAMEPNHAMVADLDKKTELEVVPSTPTDVSASLPIPVVPTIQAETIQKDQTQTNSKVIGPDQATVADLSQKNESSVFPSSESTKTVSSYGNVALDILYWEGIEDDLRYAMKNYSALYPTSPAVNQKWDYDLGVRASFFVPVFYDQWLAGVTFTHFNSTPPITRAEDPTGNIYANLNFPMIGSESFQNVYSALGKWTLRMNVIDLELKRTFIIAQSFKIQPSLGGKASWIRQKVDVHYHYVYPNFTFANRIRGFSSIWGVGPEIGVEMIFVIPKQWNLSIKGTYAGMIGLFTGNTTYSEYDDTDYESALTEKKSLLFDVTQLQCGLSKWWIFKKERSLGLTAGWEFQIWRRQMRMNWWSTATFPNQGADLTVKGPFFRGTVNF